MCIKNKYARLICVSLCMALFVTLFIATLVTQIAYGLTGNMLWTVIVGYFIAFLFLGCAKCCREEKTTVKRKR